MEQWKGSKAFFSCIAFKGMHSPLNPRWYQSTERKGDGLSGIAEVGTGRFPLSLLGKGVTALSCACTAIVPGHCPCLCMLEPGRLQYVGGMDVMGWKETIMEQNRGRAGGMTEVRRGGTQCGHLTPHTITSGSSCHAPFCLLRFTPLVSGRLSAG